MTMLDGGGYTPSKTSPLREYSPARALSRVVQEAVEQLQAGRDPQAVRLSLQRALDLHGDPP